MVEGCPSNYCFHYIKSLRLFLVAMQENRNERKVYNLCYRKIERSLLWAFFSVPYCIWHWKENTGNTSFLLLKIKEGGKKRKILYIITKLQILMSNIVTFFFFFFFWWGQILILLDLDSVWIVILGCYSGHFKTAISFVSPLFGHSFYLKI